MVSLRTIAVFLIACSAIMFVIAYQKYYNAIETAKAIAGQIEGVEFESVGVPIETSVCGFVGVLLLVAGAKLLLASVRKRDANDGEPSLL